MNKIINMHFGSSFKITFEKFFSTADGLKILHYGDRTISNLMTRMCTYIYNNYFNIQNGTDLVVTRSMYLPNIFLSFVDFLNLDGYYYQNDEFNYIIKKQADASLTDYTREEFLHTQNAIKYLVNNVKKEFPGMFQWKVSPCANSVARCYTALPLRYEDKIPLSVTKSKLNKRSVESFDYVYSFIYLNIDESDLTVRELTDHRIVSYLDTPTVVVYCGELVTEEFILDTKKVFEYCKIKFLNNESK